MPIRIVCGKCGKTLRAPDALLGKRVRCPGCQGALSIPAAVPTSQPISPAPAAPPPVPIRPPQPAPTQAPPDEFAIAPAHDLPPAPVPIAVRNALAEAEARREAQTPFAKPATPAGVKPKGTSPPRLVPPKHHYRYFIFALALFPLAWMLMVPPTDPFEEIISGFVEETEQAQQNDQEEEMAEGELDIESDTSETIEFGSLEELLESLEASKLPGAHLSKDSWMHWLYAVLAAALFLGLMLVCLPLGDASAKQLLTIGFITSTGGMLFLTAIQMLSIWAWWFPAGLHPIVFIIVWIFRLLGFAYFAVQHVDMPFLWLFLGFTVSVGLCEELTKALPILFTGRDGRETDWRGAAARGFASGVGFGVAEGILFSGSYYNGIQPFNMYLVRFLSCVTLHAIWTYAVGIMIWRYRLELADEEDWRYLVLLLFKVLAVPMVLHGLYDAAVTKDMPILALLTAFASFGWLTLQIELVRRWERKTYAEFAVWRQGKALA